MIRLIALCVVGGFCVISSYSCAKYCTDQYKAAHPIAKPRAVTIWRDANAKNLADVYSLTVTSVDDSIEIFITPEGKEYAKR